MRALVTGAAGFIGSTLSDRLVADGWSVRGVESFTRYYSVTAKRKNLTSVSASDRFELVEADLRSSDLEPLLQDVDVVFHLAGQPGVRLSWAEGFAEYNELNVNVTQRLLEACRQFPVERFVYASSSSVYGDVAVVPTDEAQPTRPHSPYGVTKLAGELLCGAYGANFGLPTVSVRYFTVYGPRQRPDMAIHRMIQSALNATPFTIFGDGSQIRDFTYVDDVVDATVRCAERDLPPGTVVNAAGGSSVSVTELIALVEESTGSRINLDREHSEPGDVRQTGGSIERAKSMLGWEPRFPLRDGITCQVAWHRDQDG